jgi:sugar lactone lactonase YvrE
MKADWGVGLSALNKQARSLGSSLVPQKQRKKITTGEGRHTMFVTASREHQWVRSVSYIALLGSHL